MELTDVTAKEIVERWKKAESEEEAEEIERFIFTRSPIDYAFPLKVEDFVDTSSPDSTVLEYIHKEYSLMYGILEDFLARFLLVSEKYPILKEISVFSFSEIYDELKRMLEFIEDKEALTWSLLERINSKYLPKSMLLSLYSFYENESKPVAEIILQLESVAKVLFKFQIKRGSRQSFVSTKERKYQDIILNVFKEIDKVILDKIHMEIKIASWFTGFGKANT